VSQVEARNVFLLFEREICENEARAERSFFCLRSSGRRVKRERESETDSAHLMTSATNDDMETDAEEETIAKEQHQEEKVDHKVQLRKLSRALEIAVASSSSSDDDALSAKVDSITRDMRAILSENNMVGCYEAFCEKFSWKVDGKELERMRAFETETMTKIESNLKDAKENLGDDDVQSALREMGDKYAQMGYKEKCVEAYEKCKETNATIGQKMEIEFS